jgi:AraC-like DNA-binding protein
MYSFDPGAGKISDSDLSLVDLYRSYYLSQGFFVEKQPLAGPPASHLRLELTSETGNGWTELIQINQGLGVGMCDYELFRTVEGDHHPARETVCFNLLMSGEFEVVVPGTTRRETIRGGELWLCRNFADCLRYSQPSNRVIRGMSIELPRSMIEAWLGDAHCGMSRSLEMILRDTNPACGLSGLGMRPLSRQACQTAPLVQAAARLLASKRDTVCGRLHFESLALDLLAQFLAFDYPTHPQTSPRLTPAIDDAIDILRVEWPAPPTIAVLARRVGLNECYLKAGFRRRTGQSIGEFVRTLRMEHALELIESGRSSILQAALAVGYSNPSHFSAAFKRHHGRLPSSYLARV